MGSRKSWRQLYHFNDAFSEISEIYNVECRQFLHHMKQIAVAVAAMDPNPVQHLIPAQQQAGTVTVALITSGESNNEEDDDDEEQQQLLAPHSDAPDYYDQHADERDALYVAQKLRIQSNTADDTTAENNIDTVVQQKPPQSDAILSCPCCFHIVCLDCQQHERYDDQYRAMFVTHNIVIDWESQWDLAAGNGSSTANNNTAAGMVERPANQQAVPAEDDPGTYYAVHCANCNTQVAYLEMKEELYHFFGCLASA